MVVGCWIHSAYIIWRLSNEGPMSALKWETYIITRQRQLHMLSKRGTNVFSITSAIISA